MVGQVLGHYRIVEKIGAGGMGEVYRARDERLDRDIALKVLPASALADEAARRRFRREALALSKLNHPNIETVYDFDSQEGVDFLVLEHVAGVSLDDKLAQGPLPEKEVLRLGMQLAEGLAAAHEQVVHRDLKPANLRITPDGRLKILDFGLARLLRPVTEAANTQSLTATQAVAGTLPYMAPEQLRGDPVDARTDIWAAGVVLCEMCTGRRPFEARTSTALAGDILHQPPTAPSELNPKISPRLEEIIIKCLEKEPENRYQSARELGVDLRRLATPTLLPGPERKPRSGRIDAVVVLPLENRSHLPEEEYFVEGMHEALITELSKIGALRVISRTSAMRYKGTDKPMSEIAKELKVDAVVEGSVLRAGNRVRITAQLIQPEPERHLWADNFDRELSDVLMLTSEVSRAIAGEIKVAVTPGETGRLARAPSVNPEAYDAYLKGRFQLNQWSAEAAKRAIRYFEKALSIDPTYAPVYAGIHDAYMNLGTGFTAAQPATAARPKGKAAALKAVEIDNGLADAHAALGATHVCYDWDWAASEEHLRRSIELNPGYAAAHQWYALLLAATGRLGDALAEARQAQEIDPVAPYPSTLVAQILYYSRSYDQAIEALREVLDLHASFVLGHYWLARALIEKSSHEEAIFELEVAVQLSARQPVMLAALGHGYAVSGARGEARKVLDELQDASKRQYVPSYNLAEIYTALGEKDQAFDLLEKAVVERTDLLIFLNVDPAWDALRPDPRFQNLARRMKFPP